MKRREGFGTPEDRERWDRENPISAIKAEFDTVELSEQFMQQMLDDLRGLSNEQVKQVRDFMHKTYTAKELVEIRKAARAILNFTYAPR